MSRQYEPFPPAAGDRRPLDEREARQCLGRASLSALPHEEPQTRFATGTHEIVRLDLEQQLRAIDDAEAPAACAPALAALPDAAFAIDLDDRLDDANVAAEVLLGYSRAELVGQKITRWISPLGKELDAARGGEHVRFVASDTGVHARHRNGGAVPVEVLLCPGDHRRTLAIVRTPAGFDECGLRADDVVQLVHDLKNPLSTMTLEMCLLDERIDETVRAAFDRIGHNVTYLDRVIQDLLDSCSLDAGQFVLHRRPTDMRTLVEQVIERAVPSRDRKRVFLEAPRTRTLSIDDHRIERVIANLLGNALKYGPNGTGIVVRLAVNRRGVAVSVIDAGPGLTAAESTTIFNKYRRATNVQRHDSHGLGLYVSRKIIDAHGGRIGVESNRGEGTRFFFELPAV